MTKLNLMIQETVNLVLCIVALMDHNFKDEIQIVGAILNQIIRYGSWVTRFDNIEYEIVFN